MVRIRSDIEKNTLFGRALVTIGAIYKKIPFGRVGRALARIRAKIEKNTLFGRALVRIRAKI